MAHLKTSRLYHCFEFKDENKERCRACYTVNECAISETSGIKRLNQPNPNEEKEKE